MPPTSLAVAVVMQRTPLPNNRWQSEQWGPVEVIPDSSGSGAQPRALLQDESRAQWLHPGFRLELFHDEAEGYYLNLSSQKPFVFVNWLEEEGAGVPKAVTVSYNEAARMLDSGARVDGVPMPPQWVPWLAEYVERNYKPEPKKRSRPPSFKGAKRDDR
jgi:hypothetical protein